MRSIPWRAAHRDAAILESLAIGLRHAGQGARQRRRQAGTAAAGADGARSRAWWSEAGRLAAAQPQALAPAAHDPDRGVAGRHGPVGRPAGAGSGAAGDQADVREELDRLNAHVQDARAVAHRVARRVGRKLDFLSQEFNREANTLCSKSADIALDPRRAGAEGGDRPVPRAGPECRIIPMSNEMQRRGLMLVLSSPSGAGKTTLSRRLLQTDPDIVMSVSATTRTPRPNEVEGQDYFFVSPEKFEAMVERRRVSGTCHRVRQPLRHAARAGAWRRWRSGKDVLFDIDWQGTQQLKQQARRRSGQHLRAAARPSRAGTAAARSRPGLRGGGAPAHGQGERRDSATGRSMTIWC